MVVMVVPLVTEMLLPAVVLLLLVVWSLPLRLVRDLLLLPRLLLLTWPRRRGPRALSHSPGTSTATDVRSGITSGWPMTELRLSMGQCNCRLSCSYHGPESIGLRTCRCHRQAEFPASQTPGGSFCGQYLRGIVDGQFISGIPSVSRTLQQAASGEAKRLN